MLNHRPNKYPGPCLSCGPVRVPATCTVDRHAIDKYKTDTITPECYCSEHCPACEAERRAAKAAEEATRAL